MKVWSVKKKLLLFQETQFIFGSFYWHCCRTKLLALNISSGPSEKKAFSNWWIPKPCPGCGGNTKTNLTWITRPWGELSGTRSFWTANFTSRSADTTLLTEITMHLYRNITSIWGTVCLPKKIFVNTTDILFIKGSGNVIGNDTLTQGLHGLSP